MDQWAQWDVVLLIKYDCDSQTNSKQCLYVVTGPTLNRGLGLGVWVFGFGFVVGNTN